MKRNAKKEIEQALQLPHDNEPVILMMARLTEQKGINILLDLWLPEEEVMSNMECLLNQGARLIICGRPSGGYNGDIHKRLLSAQRLFPGRFRYIPEYTEKIAHQLLAASDAIMCPSLYEPCGLVQIYAMSFGTIPLVRPVGGLRDTVVNHNDFPESSTGFYIEEFSFDSLLASVKQLVGIYNHQQELWQQLIQRCMRQDFSWLHIRDNYYRFFDEIREEVMLQNPVPLPG
jgi:starch synthase